MVPSLMVQGRNNEFHQNICYKITGRQERMHDTEIKMDTTVPQHPWSVI